MKVVDLGNFDTPVLLFGGPYSNLQATQALLQQAHDMQIKPSNLICTGDIAAYCAHPSETMDLIQQLDCPVVAGNCEKQLAVNAMDCGCGFDEGTTCDLLSAGWFAHASSQVTAEQRDWMHNLPDVLVFTQSGKRFAAIHGGITNISRFLWPTSPEAEFREELGAIEDVLGAVDGIIAGHCGMQFCRDLADKIWINAGAIGMPANNGSADTSFAVLSSGKPEFHSLSYDVVSAVSAMKSANLVQGYDVALQTGYWPSEDILPQELRAKR